MPEITILLLATIVDRTIDQFVADVNAAAPQILGGVVFLVIAAVAVKLILSIAHRVLDRDLPGQDVYRQFGVTVLAAFLWFAVFLAFLSIIGLNQIAAALGTATGFLALGVAYALSGMLADAVAGIYLIRDPDFMVGDTITAGDVTGEIKQIELRKTRFTVDGDTVVRSNAEVEKRWTRKEDPIADPST